MRNLAIALWATQILAAIVMLIAAVVEIESILWAGPTLTVIGLLRAQITLSIQSWITLAGSLSAPFVCALIALLIALFDWSPQEAHGPVVAILSVYSLVVLPAAAVTFRPIFKWQTKTASRKPPVWQFSLKSMLYAMSAFCLIIAVGRLIGDELLDDDGIFGGYALVVLVLCGLVIWRFFLYRRRTAGSNENQLAISD